MGSRTKKTHLLTTGFVKKRYSFGLRRSGNAHRNKTWQLTTWHFVVISFPTSLRLRMSSVTNLIKSSKNKVKTQQAFLCKVNSMSCLFPSNMTHCNKSYYIMWHERFWYLTCYLNVCHEFLLSSKLVFHNVELVKLIIFQIWTFFSSLGIKERGSIGSKI